MKRLKVGRQLRARKSKAPLQTPNLRNSAVDRACSGLYPSTLLTMAEAAEYIRFTGSRGAEACRDFLKKHGVKLLPRGRDYVVRVFALDHFLETGQGELDVIAAQHTQAPAGPTVARA